MLALSRNRINRIIANYLAVGRRVLVSLLLRRRPFPSG
jgi:hypothetical protein